MAKFRIVEEAIDVPCRRLESDSGGHNQIFCRVLLEDRDGNRFVELPFSWEPKQKKSCETDLSGHDRLGSLCKQGLASNEVLLWPLHDVAPVAICFPAGPELATHSGSLAL